MIGKKSDFGEVSSHVYFEVYFPQLEEYKVNQVWNKLIAKHEALRTVIDSWETQHILDENRNYQVLFNEGEHQCNDTRYKLMNKSYNPSI